MLNITEITAFFISVNYIEDLRKHIYAAFTLQEKFGINYYEDKYIDLISKKDSIDNDVKRDTFLLYLKQDLNKILNEHLIFLNEDMEISLEEINEFVHFLYLVQNLEDYTEVDYIINSNNTPKQKFINLLSKYSFLTIPRIMELIDVIENNFIEALTLFVKDKEIVDTESLDKDYLKNVNLFFKFINNHDCIGINYFRQGYVSLSLKELTDILPNNVSDYIDALILTNSAKAALDVLSLLIITKDNFKLPLFKFKQNNILFSNSLENITKLEYIITNIISDFNNFVEAENQKEKINDH